MKVETKFAIGDSVWSILSGRAHGFEIKAVVVEKTKSGLAVNYRDSDYHHYPESQCFLAKEDLRDYFMAGE